MDTILKELTQHRMLSGSLYILLTGAALAEFCWHLKRDLEVKIDKNHQEIKDILNQTKSV